MKTSWLKDHERIVITFLILSFGIYGFNHWLDKSAVDATTKVTVAEQAAAESKAVTAQALAQLAQQQAQFNEAETARDVQIADLIHQIASRDAASATRVKAVQAPKTPTQAVADVQLNYSLPAPIVVTGDGADVPTADLQLFTTTKINGDTCLGDLQDTRTELSAVTTGLAQASNLLVTKDGVIADLQAGEVKTKAANDAEVGKLKADARKSKWRWFWAGFATGFMGRSAMK